MCRSSRSSDRPPAVERPAGLTGGEEGDEVPLQVGAPRDGERGERARGALGIAATDRCPGEHALVVRRVQVGVAEGALEVDPCEAGAQLTPQEGAGAREERAERAALEA